MNIQSTFEKDIRCQKSAPGAYEWWYFDAISNDGKTEAVIIFYEGNPFSRRYINQQKEGKSVQAEAFPAISISVYQNRKPIYYSFTEVKRDQASFGETRPLAKVANHKMEGEQKGNTIKYTVTLNEELPSGDAINGKLEFMSCEISENLFHAFDDSRVTHRWNVTQPRAQVSGKIRCRVRGEQPTAINFNGEGYHDHNIGDEPLKNEVTDWHWGRFHFKDSTLVYYVVDEHKQHEVGWLLDKSGKKLIDVFDSIRLEDENRTLFGLNSARKLTLANEDTHVMIQQTHRLDNGPFYQRFSSDAFLHRASRNTLQKSRGITEYLCPPRIYKRLYWPLTNMRIRYKKESPHWVQRSKTLYRWTW